MGVSDSKILAQRVLTACEEAETQGQTKLKGALFWKDEVLSIAAKKVFQQVPKHLRGTRHNAAERAAIRSNSQILVPEIIKDLKNNPREILGQGELPQEGHSSSAQHTSLSDQSMQNYSLAKYYMLVDDIEKDTKFSTIRLRFFYISFFRLKQNIQPEALCPDVISLLVRIIYHSGLVKHTTDVIEKKLVTWADRGERYKLLAEDLGGLGSLFVLPDDIAESVWARDLPKSTDHERRVAVINSLKRRGITEAASGLHHSAETTLENIWNSMSISANRAIDELSQTQTPNYGGITAGNYQGNTSSYIQHEHANSQDVPRQNIQDQNRYPDNIQVFGSEVIQDGDNSAVSAEANQECNSRDQQTANQNAIPATSHMIMNSSDDSQLQRPPSIAQNSSARFQAEPDGMATMYSCAFPQFVPPASIDTVVPSFSPQYFLPESTNIETSASYPNLASTGVDIMVSSDFPQYALPISPLVGQDYSNCQTNTFCAMQTQQDINNSSSLAGSLAGVIGTPTAV